MMAGYACIWQNLCAEMFVPGVTPAGLPLSQGEGRVPFATITSTLARSPILHP